MLNGEVMSVKHTHSIEVYVSQGVSLNTILVSGIFLPANVSLYSVVGVSMGTLRCGQRLVVGMLGCGQWLVVGSGWLWVVVGCGYAWLWAVVGCG